MSNLEVGGQVWRLVGELTQPMDVHDEQWVVTGLRAALQGIQGLAPDLERVQNAAVAAVKRAACCSNAQAPMRQPVRLRLLIPDGGGDQLAPTPWGFFVLERAAGEVGGTDASGDPQAALPAGPRIELYLYPDTRSAQP